ncbi:hypothetical protein, partial [Schinkia azotoformans]|uniref:hypothetical protein n=1 Tax=Schinkia azotoformans TaxID=1454 RepID=UPI002DBE9FA6
CHTKDDIKESGLRENCTIRLIERTEEGDCRPLSTLHGSNSMTITSNERKGNDLWLQARNKM